MLTSNPEELSGRRACCRGFAGRQLDTNEKASAADVQDRRITASQLLQSVENGGGEARDPVNQLFALLHVEDGVRPRHREGISGIGVDEGRQPRVGFYGGADAVAHDHG